MPVATTIQFPQADVDALMRQIHRNSNSLGKSLGSSVKFAAWSVADALRVATKISNKNRSVEDSGERRKKGLKKFIIERFHGDKPMRKLDVYAKNKSEATEKTVVKIRNRGLAQKAWHWPQSKLGSSRGSPKVSNNTSRIAANNGSTEIHLEGQNLWISITNKLNYANDAFRSGGAQTVENTMARAATRMAHMIDSKIAKKMSLA